MADRFSLSGTVFDKNRKAEQKNKTTETAEVKSTVAPEVVAAGKETQTAEKPETKPEAPVQKGAREKIAENPAMAALMARYKEIGYKIPEEQLVEGLEKYADSTYKGEGLSNALKDLDRQVNSAWESYTIQTKDLLSDPSGEAGLSLSIDRTNNYISRVLEIAAEFSMLNPLTIEKDGPGSKVAALARDSKSTAENFKRKVHELKEALDKEKIKTNLQSIKALYPKTEG